MSMGAAVAHPISPELVLVCPELRERALTLLPSVDPDELFAVEPRATAAPQLVRVQSMRRSAPLPVALAAYFSEAIFLGVLRATALTAVIFVAAFLLSW